MLLKLNKPEKVPTMCVKGRVFCWLTRYKCGGDVVTPSALNSKCVSKCCWLFYSAWHGRHWALVRMRVILIILIILYFYLDQVLLMLIQILESASKKYLREWAKSFFWEMIKSLLSRWYREHHANSTTEVRESSIQRLVLIIDL